MRELCRDCGNNHFGPCATQETVFVFSPDQDEHPTQVQLVGSWSNWQHFQPLFKRELLSGDCIFELSLSLLKGSYEYKYVVDGTWTHDPFSDTRWDPVYHTLNNTLKVYPKKMYLPIDSQGTVRISVGIVADNLKVIGSWDNWVSEVTMQRKYNQLQGREENVANVPVQAGHEYQFIFKLNRQYLIDENYPNILNPYHTYNNIIIASQYKISESHPQLPTPTVAKEHLINAFAWEAVSKDFQLPYDQVQGHTMCNIGESIYIFGGQSRNEFYNTLIKVNVRELNKAVSEQMLPNGRAFPAMVTYGNKMILFGGHNNTVLQDYFSFEVSESKWMSNPTIKGKFPEMREKASCVLYEMFMVFFGGYYCSYYNQYERYYHDIFVLDIQNMKWVDNIAVLGAAPTGRYAHAATLLASDMFIFGGTCNAMDNVNLNDLWQINLSKVNELCWTELQPKGQSPVARHGHSMNTVGKYLVVFGGKGVSQSLDDIALYNTTINQWTYPMVVGTPPKPRFYHAATVHEDTLIIFGGKVKENRGNNHFYILKPIMVVGEQEEQEE